MGKRRKLPQRRLLPLPSPFGAVATEPFFREELPLSKEASTTPESPAECSNSEPMDEQCVGEKAVVLTQEKQTKFPVIVNIKI